MTHAHDLRRFMNAVTTLVEAEVYPLVDPQNVGSTLYHGTSVVNAASIVMQDHLKGVEDEEGAANSGVSLTDRLDRAAGYALESTHQIARDFEGGMYGERAGINTSEISDHGAVFAFDAQMILRDFEVRLVRWQGAASEERVIGDIAPLSRYLTGILLDRAAIDRWIAVFEANAKLPDDKHHPTWVGDHVRTSLAALKRLRGHPKLVSR